MRKGFLVVLAVLSLSGNLLSGQTGSFGPEIRKLYLSTDTLAGNRLLLQHEQVSDPEYIRIVGYRDFLHTILYQSKSNYDRFFSQSDKWLQKLEKIRTSTSSVHTGIAEIHLYRSLLATHFTDYRPAALELYASYKVLSKSGSDFNSSDFNKLSGIIGVLLQQVPEQYLKYLKVVGVRPSSLSGLSGLEKYYRSALPGTIEEMEGYLLMITALKEFGKEPASAWDFVKAEGKRMLDNPLIRYQSALAALKAGDCESAVELLDTKAIEKMQTAIPYWNYQLGRCKLYQNDPAAGAYLEKFLRNPGGDNYRHRVLLLAGWNYLIHGQQDKAKEYFLRIRNLSTPYTEYDQEAVRESKTEVMPNPGFIKARLLFDGGYYVRCLEVCDQLIKSGDFTDAEDGELMYRKARCEQRLGEVSQAISSFLGVMQRADAIKSYIVPNAALQLGDLYKKTGQVELARRYYQVCIDLNKYGYRDGIDREARIALKGLDK